MKLLSLVLTLFLLTNCIGIQKGAGYSVHINIDQHAKPTMEDIKLITDCLNKKEYEVVKTREDQLWKVESYKIFLKAINFDAIKHNYIILVVEYYFSESNKNSGELDKIDVRIGNTQEGSNPILKEEIDLVADSIEKKLSDRFGSKNFSIKRNIVTPM
jgi:hypothetical protein